MEKKSSVAANERLGGVAERVIVSTRDCNRETGLIPKKIRPIL